MQTPGTAPVRILLKSIQDLTEGREPVPRSLVEQYEAAGEGPLALREGYTLEGDQYVYHEPVRKVTEAERLHAEQLEAMAGLRAIQAAEAGGPSKADVVLANALRAGADAREPLPADAVARYRATGDLRFALPRGYRLEGDFWVWEEPAAQAGTAGPMLRGERPRDILDDIEDFFGGVDFSSRPDFGEYLKQAKGKARELMSVGRAHAETADQALKSLHEEGLYLRLQTADDLAQAMVRAGEGRKGWRAEEAQARQAVKQGNGGKGIRTEETATQPAQRDPIESWFDRVIDATDAARNPLVREGVFGAPVWLAQGGANAALRVAKLAYTTTRDVARAVAAGVEYLRGLGLKGFDEVQARTWIENALGVRRKLRTARLREEPGDPSLWNLPDAEILERLDAEGLEAVTRGNLEREAKERGLIDKTTAEEEAVAREEADLPGRVEAQEERELQRRELDRAPAGRKPANRGKQAGETRTAGRAAAERETDPVLAALADATTEARRQVALELRGAQVNPNKAATARVAYAHQYHQTLADALAAIRRGDQAALDRVSDYVAFEARRFQEQWGKWRGTTGQYLPGTEQLMAGRRLDGMQDALARVGSELERSRPAQLDLPGMDAVERLLNRAIDATRPGTGWTGRTSLGMAQVPVWLTQEAAHLALQAAKLAYTTTRDLARAIAAGVESLRGRTGFDEGQARAWLEDNLFERATGQGILAAPGVSEAVKGRIGEYLYQRRHIADDQAIARGIVEDFGLDQAVAMARVPLADVPGAVRMALVGEVAQRMAGLERTARGEGNAARAEELVNAQAELWDTVLPQITDPAQSLRMLQELYKVSPDAVLAKAKRDLDRAAGEGIDRRRGEVDLARVAIEQGRQDGLEGVRRDPAANEAARAAVDETVANSDETRRAIIMDLAEEWSQSTFIVEQARAAVRAKANELLNKQPRPPGLNPSQHLRRILDDLAGRAAGIAADYFQGRLPHKGGLAGLLQERLGLDEAHAGRLASGLDKEFQRQVADARARLPKRIATARAARELMAEGANDQAVDRAIRKQLRELNVKLGDVLRAEASAQENTGRHVAQRVVDRSGLTGPKADALRTVLERRWNALVKEGQERALAELQRRSQVKLSRPMRNAFDRAVELDRLGALTAGKFLELVKQVLKLPRLSEADARVLRKIITDAQAAPAGFQKQRLQAQGLTMLERLKGELSWWDAPMAVWYANIFSNPMSHVANTIGNGMKLLETVGIELAHRPLAAGEILSAAARGLEKGSLEAAYLARTGSVEGSRLLKLEAARPLEALRLPGRWDYILTPWRLVGRALAAEDMVPFKAHEEVRWTLLARRVARSEGLPMWGARLNERVAELLHNTRADWESARVQAAGEGLQGLDLARRTREIIEQRREQTMPGSAEIARDFALKQTYNADPFGMVGAVAEIINAMNRKLVVTRFAIPVVRIVANLNNESLNFFPPVGLARAALAKWGPVEVRMGKRTFQFRGMLDGKPITNPDAMFHQVAQAAVGTLIFGALAMWMAETLEDDDPPLAVYGQGPRTKGQRELLRATGWMPNSVKIGKRYYSFQESQVNLPLAILGNYFDAIRWKNLDHADAVNRVAYAMQTVSDTLLDRNMLSGLTQFLQVLKSESTQQAGTGMAAFFARAASSFAVPNALRWVDQVFDPTVYEARDVQGALLRQVPVARREGQPALNVLGEPVTRPPLSRFTKPARPDALVQVLAQKRAWPPAPNFWQQTVFDSRRGPDFERPMTPEEFYTMIATSGPAIRRNLELNLEILRTLEPEQAQAFVRNMANMQHKVAKARLAR